MDGNIILLTIFCRAHEKETWHVMRKDGAMICLECRAEGRELTAPVRASELSE